MDARQQIADASFLPDVLPTLLQAFDDAWAEYDRSLGRDQRGDFVRKMLADIVISLARRGPVKDAWSLKEDAMKELSSTYRIPPPWLP